MLTILKILGSLFAITMILVFYSSFTYKPVEETDILDEENETEYSDQIKLVPRDTQPTITKTIPT